MTVTHGMDSIDDDYDMPELTEPRLPVITVAEAHELLEVLRHFSDAEHHWGNRARHLAMELAARVPSAN